MDPIAFNAGNGQLEVVPEFFEDQNVFPFEIEWLIAPGDAVTAGQVLGRWVFPRQTDTMSADLVCPEAAAGRKLREINDATDFVQLDQDPAQVLAFFA